MSEFIFVWVTFELVEEGKVSRLMNCFKYPRAQGFSPLTAMLAMEEHYKATCIPIFWSEICEAEFEAFHKHCNRVNPPKPKAPILQLVQS